MNTSIFQRAYRDMMTATRVTGIRVRAVWSYVVTPVSRGEDERRREYILNIILFISIIFLVVLACIIVNNYFLLGGGYHGINPLIFISIIVFYAILLFLSKRGLYRISAYTLIGSYTLCAIYSGWMWGESLPATILTNTLIIVMSSILIGSSFGIKMTTVMVAIMVLLGLREGQVLGLPAWHMQIISITDIAGYVAILIFIGFITWLSNREIDASLDHARRSEQILAEERNSLELRIAERTEELLSNAKREMEELSMMARFGEISKGLFHDLINPLSSMTLYVESLVRDGEDTGRAREAQETIAKMTDASRRMYTYMNSIKRSIGSAEVCIENEMTNLRQEVSTIKDIFGYKARMEGVSINIGKIDDIHIKAHPIKIHQILSNIVSNGIEACKDNRQTERQINITAKDRGTGFTIEISDNGCGISEKHIDNIFNRHFTTKDNGTGIGLFTTKSLVENELHGEIIVTSQIGTGTTFTIHIPHEKQIQDSPFKKSIHHIYDGRETLVSTER